MCANFVFEPRENYMQPTQIVIEFDLTRFSGHSRMCLGSLTGQVSK